MRRTPPPPPHPGWAYFFDLDGTLSDLADTPEAARVSPALLERVALLARRTGGAVAIVSGRTMRDIDALLGGVPVAVAAQHGAELRTSDGRAHRIAVESVPLDATRLALAQLVAKHQGLLLEDKGGAMALHYRAAPRLAGFAHRIMRAQQRDLGTTFVIQPGKRVVELLPRGIDKGQAVRAFLDEPPFRGRLPVFLGDDITDERAFAEVEAHHGVSIKVGPGPSSARWRLADVDSVREWLSASDAWPITDRTGTA